MDKALGSYSRSGLEDAGFMPDDGDHAGLMSEKGFGNVEVDEMRRIQGGIEWTLMLLPNYYVHTVLHKGQAANCPVPGEDSHCLVGKGSLRG